MFLAITESKKKVTGYDEEAQVTYEKHKIFLYKEDFDKFVDGLVDVVSFIKNEQGDTPQREFRHATEAEPEVVQEVEIKNEDEPKKGFFNKFKF